MAKSKRDERQRERYGAFLFYVDDWLSSTAIEIMTAAEERGFLRLLLHAWKSEDCGLPDDDRVLAVLSKLGAEWETGGSVLRQQFTARGGRLYNERLLEEREYQRSYRDAKSKGGKAGAEARWALPSDGKQDGEPVTEGMANGWQSDANPNPNPNPSKSVQDTWFETEFWPLYPKKADKPHALNSARAKGKTPEEREAIMAGLRAQLATLRDWKARGVCPNPGTWLNGERWNDEPAVPTTQPTPASGPAPVVSTMDPETARRIREARRG